MPKNQFLHQLVADEMETGVEYFLFSIKIAEELRFVTNLS